MRPARALVAALLLAVVLPGRVLAWDCVGYNDYSSDNCLVDLLGSIYGEHVNELRGTSDKLGDISNYISGSWGGGR